MGRAQIQMTTVVWRLGLYMKLKSKQKLLESCIKEGDNPVSVRF